MHIPDGYLGPQTYVPAFAVMAVAWTAATRTLQKTLRARQVPLLAVGAAFTFVVMMFNVPIPGGTTGHAVGAVLVAIMLGPWAAVVAVSLALIVQALLFGDGGITAIGANCLTMALVMPFSGWWTYRLVAGKAPVNSPRHWIGGAIGGYVGLNLAALATAVLFGIQPLLAQDAAGHPLYSPFGLKVAIPVMALGHLTVFGLVEALATGLVLKWFQKAAPEMLPQQVPRDAAPARSSLLPRLAGGLIVMALLSPLGLYLPAKFGAGSAWGEWSADELAKIVGYVPKGLARDGGLWSAPLAGYTLQGQSESLLVIYAVYIASALIGILALVGVTLALRSVLAHRERDDAASRMDARTNRRT